MQTKPKQNYGSAMMIVSLLYRLMLQISWINEDFADLVEDMDQQAKEFHIQKINRMVDIVHDETIPLFIKEFLVLNNFRHFECHTCGTHFSPVETYLLLSGKKVPVSRYGGNSVFGYEFACCYR